MLFYCYFLAQVECVLWQVCLFLVVALALTDRPEAAKAGLFGRLLTRRALNLS